MKLNNINDKKKINKQQKNKKAATSNALIKRGFAEIAYEAPIFDVLSSMPLTRTCFFKYNDNSMIRNAPGATFLVYSMRINDLNDPDPLILSGSVSEVKENMQFYDYYRVDDTYIRWTVVNNENFALLVGIVFSLQNLTGTLASVDDCRNALESSFSTRVRMVSPKGGIDQTKFSVHAHLPKIQGTPGQYHNDIAYSGNGLASPPRPIWANFIAFSANSSVLANGYSNSTTLVFKSHLFGRLNLRA